MTELENVNKEIEEALKGCGREKGSVRLIVASKYFNIEEILKLYQQGQRDFGENKVQDALAKIEALPKDICWHFIGHLQKNKINKIIGKFNLIHSIDSLELAQKISEKANQEQKVLIQINTSLEESKGGFSEKEFMEIYPQIEKLPNIKVEGLMTLGPLSENAEIVRDAFKALFTIKRKLNKDFWNLSMGMSQDFNLAIEEGAQFVRIGRRLLPR